MDFKNDVIYMIKDNKIHWVHVYTQNFHEKEIKFPKRWYIGHEWVWSTPAYIVYHLIAEISIGAHYVANSSLDMNWIMHLPWHMWCTQMGLLNVVMRTNECFMFQLEHKVVTKENWHTHYYTINNVVVHQQCKNGILIESSEGPTKTNNETINVA